ncbi:MAG: aminotransferase class III-fold pyridoxal phosphate-dependent enzyme, partial [Acidobacteria bacterium]|nr:aminotransferase class III-fold pyridoxal phosphate-dependent enzyme [Acidobacteriota bacterium]
MSSPILQRNIRKTYLQAKRAEGCFIYDDKDRAYLDAAGSGAVVSIGHGVREIGEAMARQAGTLDFTHTSQFVTPISIELAARLRAMTPAGMRESARTFFTSGGSEATETAIKLARQYWLERGQPQRVRVVSRKQSYHGATIGALSVSGNVRRREPFAPLLSEWGHIEPCFCYRCPYGKTFPECKIACADDLESFVQKVGSESVAAFIAEPISGATLGAAIPPDGYFQRIAEICRRHEILLIADEVMTGMGRTGKNFAVEHWDITPDMITTGKGVASGYAPLGAVIAAGHVCETLEKGSGAFLHGFTYNAHPVALAAGLAVLDYAAKHRLFERVVSTGAEMMRALEPLKKFPVVGDIRGIGLLFGIEFVKDRTSREPFPISARIADRVYELALEQGVTTYPMHGSVDGHLGDHLLLA